MMSTYFHSRVRIRFEGFIRPQNTPKDNSENSHVTERTVQINHEQKLAHLSIGSREIKLGVEFRVAGNNAKTSLKCRVILGDADGEFLRI
jgi:hypothetical protein